MDHVVDSVLRALMRTTISLGVAALVVQMVLRWWRPTLPRVHRIVWLLVLVQGWFWWQWPLQIPYYEPAAPALAAPKPAPPESVVVGDVALPPAVESQRSLESSPATSRPWRNFFPVILVGLWAAGIVGLASAGLWGYLRFLGQLLGCGSAEREWTHQWEELCKQRRVRPVPLRVSTSAGPLLCLTPWGYRLVVPAPLWQRLGAGERLSILRHELAHRERSDVLKSMLVRLLVLPQWFNPLAWLAARRFDEAAEWACDEAALGPGGRDGGQYAQALLQLDAVLGQYSSYRAAAWGRGLSARIARLLNPRMEEDSLMKRMAIQGTALGLVAVCLFRVSLVAQEPPPSTTPAEAAGTASPAAVRDFQALPQDTKLTKVQRAFRDWDAEQFGVPDPALWQKLSASERTEAEEKYLKQLAQDNLPLRSEAIDALVGLGCQRAVPEILRIATERQEGDNWARDTATRALGMLGDIRVVPELVHLTYHYNMNVRLAAQISLVRLTGENFGRDTAAWARWWKEQGRTPAISEEKVVWATSPETLQYADPQKQEEMDRQMEAQFRQQRAMAHPRDNKLNIIQRAMRNLTEQSLAYQLNPSRWENLPDDEREKEEAYWVKQLASEDVGARNLAIYVLTVLKSKKAIPGLLAIATERTEKDNADRSYACRALGIVGDPSVVPELVPLVYHYNRDTRLWAQISLVRLTGENFGRDVATWARWWAEQGHTPAISVEPVAWATSPEMLQYADLKAQETSDAQLLQGQ